MSDVIPLAEAARRIRISYYCARKLLVTEQLEPAERPSSDWYVSAEAVARLLNQQAVVSAIP